MYVPEASNHKFPSLVVLSCAVTAVDAWHSAGEPAEFDYPTLYTIQSHIIKRIGGGGGRGVK